MGQYMTIHIRIHIRQHQKTVGEEAYLVAHPILIFTNDYIAYMLASNVNIYVVQAHIPMAYEDQ
jgi:hypothetical protein